MTKTFWQDHTSPSEAVVQAAMIRFRPIVLTSLTTFFGLAPMIFESALQARFIIPMAISLGFGILFGTVIILTIVPSVYLILEDLVTSKAKTSARSPSPPVLEPTPQYTRQETR